MIKFEIVNKVYPNGYHALKNISLEIIKNISDISYLFITFLNFFAFKTQFTIAKAGVAEV